jgi:phospholipase C
MRRRLGSRAAALVASLLAAGVMTARPAATQPADPAPADSAIERRATTTPIKHFITLMQENHSFDNYFGTYPGANGIPEGTCMPIEPDDPAQGCIQPFHIEDRAITDLGHSAGVFRAQYADGEMNGFVSVFARQGQENADQSMGYYDDRDIPYYWNVADSYVLFDSFFTSGKGGSVQNHVYWVAGQPGVPDPYRDSVPAEGWDMRTIFDDLDEAGVSWKFYVQNYDPSINLRNKGAGDKSAQVVWVPLLNFPRYLDDPEQMAKIVDLEQYYVDLAEGTLPEVAYIVPSGASEHPPGSIAAGEAFVRTLLNSLKRSSAWSTSAFVWTYDDWGGWFDHVPPPQVDEFGFGFRAPTLLVSPYAREGFVDSTVLDFTSILKFIQENWGLPPLAARDAAANNFLGAFDFDAPPRAPVLLGVSRTVVEPKRPNQVVVYAGYGSAIAFGVAVMLAARRREQLEGRAA